MQCPCCGEAANTLDVQDFGMCIKCHDQVMNDQADFDNAAFASDFDPAEYDDMYADEMENEYSGLEPREFENLDMSAADYPF